MVSATVEGGHKLLPLQVDRHIRTNDTASVIQIVVVVGAFLACLYRFGPSRETAKWRWVTLGSVVAAVFWIAGSMAFSWYVSSFDSYNRTYGSLGAGVGFMVWIWLSVVIVLVGAELNAEMEHQTAQDTTVGEPQPLGARRARMADTIGTAAEDSPSRTTST